MKVLLLMMVWIIIVSASCERNDAAEVEDMTDKEVINLLTSASAYEFKTDDVCIIRPESFKGLILVGLFAHDRGCSGTACFYNRKKYSVKEVSATVLNNNGWSDKELRKPLILKWVEEVETAWSSLVETVPDKFGDGFTKPGVSESDEGYTAIFWIQRPSGMLPEDNYDKIKLVFNLKGEILSSEKLAHKQVKYKDN